MKYRWTTLAAIAVVVGVTSPAFAQSSSDPSPPPVPSRAVPLDGMHVLAAPDLSDPDPAVRHAELKRWIDEFTRWQTWSAEWSNRRQPGLFSDYQDRLQRPAPPAWLADRCVTVLGDDDPLMPGCARFAEWRDDRTPIRQARAAATMQREEAPHTTWWEHVHMDVLWPSLQWQGNIYGVVGMHFATEVKGRWQVFTAPGAVLLNLPSRNGSRAWKVAANYGIGYRLLDFALPGGRPAELHVNLAKTWILSDSSDVITGRSIDLVGFSISFKR